MNEPNEHWLLGRGSFCIDRDATTDDLLGDATEWMECARCLTSLLADIVGETEIVDRRRLIYALTAIGALAHMGMQCAIHAHARMYPDPDSRHVDTASTVRTKIGEQPGAD